MKDERLLFVVQPTVGSNQICLPTGRLVCQSHDVDNGSRSKDGWPEVNRSISFIEKYERKKHSSQRIAHSIFSIQIPIKPKV